MAMFCVNFLDRVNISFAALQMNRDLGLTPEVYGLAAGILFVTYTACEIPSNLLLERIGAGRWLARIMVTWGIVAVATSFVHGRYSLFAARGLLGVAEAGFAPGAMVYLMRWFPEADRGRAITTYLVGSPISLIIGGPLSAALLSMDGFAGLAGWRWLFILEGVPSVVLGVVAFWWLTDKPAQATWLDPQERAWLAARMATEAAAKRHTSPARLIAVFHDPATLMLTGAKFATLVASYGITLWLPQIVKEFGHISTMQIGLLTTIPWIFAAIASVLVGRSSDRTGERIWHIAIPAFVGALAFVLAAHWRPSGGDDRHQRGGDGSVGLQHGLLDVAHQPADRHFRGGRTRPHQQCRQSRRLRRPISDRPDPRCQLRLCPRLHHVRLCACT